MTPNDTPRCHSLMIIGAGVMGQGIARLFADAGITVTLVDPRDVDFSRPRVTLVRHLPPEAAPDLVIEAVFEDRAVKQGCMRTWSVSTVAAPWWRRTHPACL